MVKEIKNCFDTILKPIKDARALRDELAEQVRRPSFGKNWHGAIVSDADVQVRNLKKTENFSIKK